MAPSAARGSSPRVRGKRDQPVRHVPVPGLIPACAGKTDGTATESAPTRAHPRVCGENDILAGDTRAATGSSPRVRGKQAGGLLCLGPFGLIPACAGKTIRRSRLAWSGGAHPRVCGENDCLVVVVVEAEGSSPRVRGKRPPAHRCDRARRLIPACAGKTGSAGGARTRSSAHPRVCGENFFRPFPVAPRVGSSPRVRGKRDHARLRARPPGLIPACAGKTRPRTARGRSRRAHPRVCGENETGEDLTTDFEGSSPRVRGKPAPGTASDGRPRLIPACAGKTPSKRPPSGRSGAHPRVCGENWENVLVPMWVGGSSPRVRGKRRDHRGDARAGGLIPACAGKTQWRRGRSRRRRAHPRVCGENHRVWFHTSCQGGSSPRVRGKQKNHESHAGRGRLIPACAGKTPGAAPGAPSPAAHPRVCGENLM